jgi:succinate dehydrogenase hydrophobic anchor subunit
MKNELRTIADNYHTKKQAEHTLKLQNYVSRYVLPEIRKIAERGGYQYRIENFNHAFWITTSWLHFHVKRYHLISSIQIIITKRELKMMIAVNKFLRFCSHCWVSETKPAIIRKV